MTRFPTFSPEYRGRWVERGLWLDRTLQAYFDAAVSKAPKKEAIVFPNRDRKDDEMRPYLSSSRIGDDYRITFRDWSALSDALAVGLLAQGIGFEDIVSVQLPNWPEMCLLQIALARIGAVSEEAHARHRADLRRQAGQHVRDGREHRAHPHTADRSARGHSSDRGQARTGSGAQDLLPPKIMIRSLRSARSARSPSAVPLCFSDISKIRNKRRPPAMRKGGFSRVTSASWTRRDTFTWPGGRKS